MRLIDRLFSLFRAPSTSAVVSPNLITLSPLPITDTELDTESLETFNKNFNQDPPWFPQVINWHNKDEYIKAARIVESYFNETQCCELSDRYVLEAYIKGACEYHKQDQNIDVAGLKLSEQSDQDIIRIARHVWYYNEFNKSLESIDNTVLDRVNQARKKAGKGPLDLRFQEHQYEFIDARCPDIINWLADNFDSLKEYFNDNNPYIAAKLLDIVSSAIRYYVVQLEKNDHDTQAAIMLKKTLETLSKCMLQNSVSIAFNKACFSRDGFNMKDMHLYWLVHFAHHYVYLTRGYYSYYKSPAAKLEPGQCRKTTISCIRQFLGQVSIAIKHIKDTVLVETSDTLSYQHTLGTGNVYSLFRDLYGRDVNETQVAAHDAIPKIMEEQCKWLAGMMEKGCPDDYSRLSDGIKLQLA